MKPIQPENVEQNYNFECCPLCGSALIDDYWDIVEETKDGGFILDAFEAWVCKRKCGFYIRKNHFSAKKHK